MSVIKRVDSGAGGCRVGIMGVDIVSRCVELPSEPGLPPCDVGVHAGSGVFDLAGMLLNVEDNKPSFSDISS